ncbi:MAG: BMP family ABC transporter substrate-binding protein [Acidiferrobacterales bacterium]|nr:BMP family ABC transporter substrate-binding protein [Acidiferrobacterales bacterium]
MKRITLALAAALFGLTASSIVLSDDPVKVGFVYIGPVGDHGWTYQHNEGRLAVEQAFGDKVQTTYVEFVPEGQDSERVIRQLAADGHDLIFTTSFGYMNPTNKVAKNFPDVHFEHATGYKRGDNVATYSARFYEGRYVIGQIAGAMTKSNVIGYIASFPIPEVVRGINSFTLGLHSVNPDARVKVVWVSTWFDPGKEGDAAKALIDQGADVITQHTDSPAPLQVAEERGILAFGQASDMHAFAPKAHLTAIVNNWGPYYVQRTQDVMDGNWQSQDVWAGIADGMVVMADFNAESLPAEVIAKANETVEGIRNRTLHPFTGPIMDQAGNEVVAAGEVMSDGDLLGMNYYVMGVDGSVPN